MLASPSHPPVLVLSCAHQTATFAIPYCVKFLAIVESFVPPLNPVTGMTFLRALAPSLPDTPTPASSCIQ